MNAVLLLSGGMDSAALAYWQRPAHALTIDYGQVAAEGEFRAAVQIARQLGITHHVLTLDLRTLGLGRMAGQRPDSGAPTPEWWPFRNQLLITLAAAKAATLGVDAVMIGTLKTDGLHADGRPEFVAGLNDLLMLQERHIRLIAPALKLDAVELARRARVPASVYGWTHSCHVANHACGLCRGCQKHLQTLAQLQLESGQSKS
ncbi:7-cyano-7-deazaguanine synthase [Variovorax sp. AFSI2.2]|uniref:7-cyano-7-deazaguanine synthase n=1 Tax=Variovorax sp. AFSI2.2 TaxID=3384160 RepID=UPI003EB8F72D